MNFEEIPAQVKLWTPQGKKWINCIYYPDIHRDYEYKRPHYVVKILGPHGRNKLIVALPYNFRLRQLELPLNDYDPWIDEPLTPEEENAFKNIHIGDPAESWE